MNDTHLEIAAIIRQITSCVSFLPILDQNDVTFNILCYTSKSATAPQVWKDSDGMFIENAEEVGLRSFSTGEHVVGGMVSYRVDDDAF